MKLNISKITLTTLAIVVFSLSACSGKYEGQGKHIGKQMDNFEKNAKNSYEQGKETVKKNAHDMHEKTKDKANELVDKS